MLVRFSVTIYSSTTESWIDRQTLETEIPAIYKDWLNNDYIQDWARKRAAKNIGAPQSGATRHPYEPSYLFESGVLQLECFSIKGVIWYQGESNAHNVELHEDLFQLLIRSWRSHWNQPELPFYFVQLSGINRYEASAEIKNDKVTLKVNADVVPKYVRYAWKPFTRANLINGSGLPASTFEFHL